jgi:preprotein translocase subunit SecF
VSRLGQIGHRLYTGELSIEFVGRRKLWYAISVAILIVSVLAVLIRGLNFGIEFRGGAEFRVPAAQCSVEQARDAAGALTESEPVVQTLGNGDLRVQTEALTEGEPDQVRSALAETCGVPADSISTQLIGPSWGEEITNKAVIALIVFLVLVVGFIWIIFERKMAIAAIVALLHDIVITVGLYALVGFDVTPSTLIGLLTILGYSLYDTVVVFDSIRENTRGITASTQTTYSEAANLSVNQTLVRSINTSLIALLPVAAILFFGAYVLGAGTLKDLSLVLFVGIAASTYSSIFIATPLLADLKEREPAMKALRRRVELRRTAIDAKAAAKSAVATTLDEETKGAVATATIVDPTERRQPQRTSRAQRRPGPGKKRR